MSASEKVRLQLAMMNENDREAAEKAGTKRLQREKKIQSDIRKGEELLQHHGVVGMLEDINQNCLKDRGIVSLRTPTRFDVVRKEHGVAEAILAWVSPERMLRTVAVSSDTIETQLHIHKDLSSTEFIEHLENKVASMYVRESKRSRGISLTDSPRRLREWGFTPKGEKIEDIHP